MAEERLHLPVGPESSKPVVSYQRRNSTGSYALPRYMRASVGSCHDHCKWGKKHSTEEKVRRVFSKRIVARPSNHEQHASVKGTPAVKSEKASSAPRIHGNGASDIMIGKVSTKSHLIKITRRNEVVTEKKVSLPGPRSYASPKAKDVSFKNKKCSSTSPSEALRAKKPLRASEPSAEKRAVNSKELPRITSSSSSSRAASSLKQSFSRAASLTARKLKSWRTVSSLKNQNNTSMDEEKHDIKETKKDEPKEKTLHVIKVEDEDQPFESEKIEDSSALECSSRLESMGKTCAIKMEDKALESNRRETRSIESVTRLSVSEESPSLQICETLPSTSDVDGEDDVITESGAESVSGDDEVVSVRESFPLKGRNRGKVVCVQSENNGLRTLKFRRGRTLEPNLNDEGCGREKVVLKHHQDFQGKKDKQGLFNNVIEQTACKLVKSRKSKVKALVGAFETVISLQDRKPSDRKPAKEEISDS